MTDVDCPTGKQCVSKDVPGLGSVKTCEAPTTTDPSLPVHCSDGLAGTGETGLDCGDECGKCPPGEGCAVDGDCLQQVCTASVCAAPSCGDGKKNGDETGVDCGGTQCAGAPPCPVCTGPSDCAPGESCDLGSGQCEGPGCLDGLQNGGETGPDCGGPCVACDAGGGCLLAGDCVSQVCLGGTCRAPSCSDNVQNQGESAIDCGGSGTGCARCGVGASCAAASDCTSGVCTSGTCAPSSCSDGVKNGLDLAQDCGAMAGCPRFLREASAAGRIGSPHIVETFDAGWLSSGEPYLVMEYLEGENLGERLARARGTGLPPREVASILEQACRGVAAAHATGILHRDLKPDNLFLCRPTESTSDECFVKIVDFGVSKFDDRHTVSGDATAAGAFVGTPAYMAPEQFEDAASADARADVYALGIILYECLTGAHPYPWAPAHRPRRLRRGRARARRGHAERRASASRRVLRRRRHARRLEPGRRVAERAPARRRRASRPRRHASSLHGGRGGGVSGSSGERRAVWRRAAGRER